MADNSDNKVVLSTGDARKLFWDVLASNLLVIVITISVLVQIPWLWLQIVFGYFVLSTIFHSFQVKKVLIKGKLFKRKVKADDGSKGA